MRAQIEPTARARVHPTASGAAEAQLQRFREAAADFLETGDLGPHIRIIESNLGLLIARDRLRDLPAFRHDPVGDSEMLAAGLDAITALRDLTGWVIHE